VVGIDVSSTRLRQTKKLKRKYSLNNLEIYQLPIERVHELEHGRTGITMLREYCGRLGIDTLTRKFRDGLVVVLKTLPHGRPLEYLLRQAPDFQRADALAAASLECGFGDGWIVTRPNRPKKGGDAQLGSINN
jgi:hypothetical protein